MLPSRAPRGIPTGGRFTANINAEPTISLEPRSPWEPGHGIQPSEERDDAADGSTTGHTTTAQMKERERAVKRAKALERSRDQSRIDASIQERRHLLRSQSDNFVLSEPAPEYEPGIRGAAEKVGDEIADTTAAIGAVASHMADVHRGDVPAPETEGGFVGWGQTVPKFLRRKDKSAAAADEVHEFSDSPNGRRLEAEVDHRQELSETPKPARGTDFWNGINSMDEITTPENRARGAKYLNNGG